MQVRVVGLHRPGRRQRGYCRVVAGHVRYMSNLCRLRRFAPALDLKQNLDALYDGTKCICNFADDIMIPQLTALIKPNERETAVKETYFRM